MRDVLLALLLSGLMGLLGQGIRAAVGLKSAATLSASTPTQQSQFNTAYFGLSLMIGFIAGVLAGVGLLDQVMNVTASNIRCCWASPQRDMRAPTSSRTPSRD
jgi:hypothetical protein